MVQTVRDYGQLKLDYFSSSFVTVEEFFQSIGQKTANVRHKTIGRTKEKQERKARLLEQAKLGEEMSMRKKTQKFYQNMQNAMMSHAQYLIEYKEMKDADGNIHKVPVFTNIGEARLAIKEVRTFNGDVNSFRDLGIRNNEEGNKLANVQFVFTNEDEEDLGEE